MSTLFAHELDLPARGRSRRATARPVLQPGASHDLLVTDAPGCLRHWWLTYGRPQAGEPRDPAHDLVLEIFYDGADQPAIRCTVAQFFGVLMQQELYEAFHLQSAALAVLPLNACNSYLPMPFAALRIRITNRCQRPITIWFMGDWHEYDHEPTPLRLTLSHAPFHPAPALDSVVLADYSGRGFIAGLIKCVRAHDDTDAWFHTGGDLWLLDGEHDPHALRGIGGEDLFGMSYGIWNCQTPWVGTAGLRQNGEHGALGGTNDGTMYRFFGPDPIHFAHSAVLRFGCHANDIESVVYAYLDAKSVAEAPLTVDHWRLAGPFACCGEEDFDRHEWAEDDPATWPREHVADFAQYVVDDTPTTFSLPRLAASEHGWCELARHFRGRTPTNAGAQPVDVSAYAHGDFSIPTSGRWRLSIGFDDRIRVWIDGELVHEGVHANGFAVDHIDLDYSGGQHTILIKLSNADNLEWRLWAFACTLHPLGS